MKVGGKLTFKKVKVTDKGQTSIPMDAEFSDVAALAETPLGTLWLNKWDEVWSRYLEGEK